MSECILSTLNKKRKTLIGVLRFYIFYFKLVNNCIYFLKEFN